MKSLNKALVLIAFFFSFISIYSQNEAIDYDLSTTSFNTILEKLPKISVDSTELEITEHVSVMLDWMYEEHYKSSFAPILIYADKGLSLSEKSRDHNHIHEARTIIGNTLIRINDTVAAKNLFLKSLKEARKANDSSTILRTKGNLANIYYYTKGSKNKTRVIYLESIEIAERLKDTTRLFILHHNLARIYNETKNADSSAYHISKTEYYLNLIGSPPHYVASHGHNKGQQMLILNRPKEALRQFEKTIAICENTEFTDALIEGYEGAKDALEMLKDYEGAFMMSKKLETYKEEEDKNKAQNIIESVSARLNVERYKEKIESKEFEKKLLVEQADRKNIILVLVAGLVVFLLIILYTTFLAKQKSEQLALAKARFFANVSHELRTPLYGVIGLSSILMENNDLKKHEKDFKSLKFSANYLLALINDLLQFNKIENNSFTKEEIQFNIRDQISTIISSFEYMRVQHKNDIRVNLSNEIPTLVRGNSVRLSQILMNLVGNACKFTKEGIIDVIINVAEITDKEVKLEFIIKDTGAGIEKYKLKSIFEEFTQIDSSDNTYQGTGLGLPIVRKLLEQAGSSIEVESDLGKGSIFTFNLSLETVQLNEQEAENESVLDVNQLAKKHILIVEDNKINQIVTRKILESSLVKCEIAENGKDAVAMVKDNNYDLILMDINMPVMNGIDATKEIRGFNDSVPIIALTAVEIEEQRHFIFESGMNDIMLKPYDIDIFKRTIVKNLVNSSPPNTFRKLA